MSSLLYREDMGEVRERLTTWWNDGDIGRPIMLVTAPREEPLEDIEILPEPEGWFTDYSTSNFDYRVNLSARASAKTIFLGEAVPAVSPDLAPNCLALYLGCKGVEHDGTVWCEPFLDCTEKARFEFQPDNFYWNFTLRLGRKQLRLGHGKFLVAFPDLIEELDTLVAMRGNERLLFDLTERPEWVRNSLCEITDCYFHYYDILYDILHDETGGSTYWVWAPGRMAKFQCDFSAMISSEMFGEFMVPVLSEMCERVSYCVYHWDGPGALIHHQHLLSIPRLKVLQWVPGAGVEPAYHRKWWPLYHKTIEAGKKIFISCDASDKKKALQALKNEFSRKLKQFVILMRAESAEEAETLLEIVSD